MHVRLSVIRLSSYNNGVIITSTYVNYIFAWRNGIINRYFFNIKFSSSLWAIIFKSILKAIFINSYWVHLIIQKWISWRSYIFYVRLYSKLIPFVRIWWHQFSITCNDQSQLRDEPKFCHFWVMNDFVNWLAFIIAKSPESILFIIVYVFLVIHPTWNIKRIVLLTSLLSIYNKEIHRVLPSIIMILFISLISSIFL
jgi:hypothetical protein